jgi:hypothetical protein
MSFRFRISVILFSLTAYGFPQVTTVTNDTATPIPGSGHDYIKMLSETVNPANGSVSLRIELPVIKGRQLTLPFSVAYDSNTVHHLLPAGQPNYGQAKWASNIGYLSQGGWSYSLPMASASEWDITAGNWPNTYTCNTWSNYMFSDGSGGEHALGLGTQFSPSGACPGDGLGSRQSGDPEALGFLPNGRMDQYNLYSYPPTPVTVSTRDGTMYTFSTTHHTVYPGSPYYMLPTTIEDRNGNLISVADNNNGNFTVTDTAGRPAVTSSGFGPSGTTNTLTISGLPYQLTWRTISAQLFDTVNLGWTARRTKLPIRYLLAHPSGE